MSTGKKELSRSASARVQAAESVSRATALPPSDSPLTEAFLGEYLSSLMQETASCLKMPHKELAHQLSIPEAVLQDALEGKISLKRGKWVKLGQLLSLSTTFALRPSERNGATCWELCYPPVPLTGNKI